MRYRRVINMDSTYPSMEQEVHRIIYLAKNLKAFYLPGRDERSREEEIKELSGRFRYRRVGIFPGTLPPKWIKPPLTEVPSPAPFRLREAPPVVSETLSLSSLFMTPVISSPCWRELLEELMCYRIHLRRPLSRREFQFNLRLLTYIPVDLSGRPLAERGREAIIKDCEKRFWRFREEAGEGEVRIGVIDPTEYAEEAPGWALNPVGVIFLD